MGEESLSRLSMEHAAGRAEIEVAIKSHAGAAQAFRYICVSCSLGRSLLPLMNLRLKKPKFYYYFPSDIFQKHR
jgi:hypothetical protein